LKLANPSNFGVMGGGVCAVPETEDPAKPSYRLYYFGIARQKRKSFYLDDVTDYEVDIIDTWDMKITHAGTFRGKFTIELPSKQYMAVRITVK
jgi:hypothetical protein